MTNSNGTNTTTNDPLSITTCLVSTALSGGRPQPQAEYVLLLHRLDHAARADHLLVSTADRVRPELTRTQSGTTSVLAEQVIGFKVGAMAWNVTDDNTL